MNLPQPHLLRPSLHRLFLTKTQYPFAFSSFKFSANNCISIHRLFLSTATTEPEAPPPQPYFSAMDYLIQSCGLSSQEALRASQKIDHLKSPDKPQAVLQFLTDTGICESHIRKAVLRDARVLRSSVEKNWRPNVVKLQEVGFSIEDISHLISRHPTLFNFNIVSRIDFWMRALGSENVSLAIRRGPILLCSCSEKIGRNLSFLKEQMGLHVPQILFMIKQAPSLITSSHEALMIKAKEAEELGFSRSSRMFVHALIVVSNLNQMTIESRLNNFRNHGFSQGEITALVSKQPYVLKLSEELMGRKLEFLIKEVGCDKMHVLVNPVLLNLSLTKRLIPRNLVRKFLESKGLLVANRKFTFFACPSEDQFAERFVLPYEHASPGLHQAYADACAGKIRGVEWFKSNL